MYFMDFTHLRQRLTIFHTYVAPTDILSDWREVLALIGDGGGGGGFPSLISIGIIFYTDIKYKIATLFFLGLIYANEGSQQDKYSPGIF